jgi:hypothetical protein
MKIYLIIKKDEVKMNEVIWKRIHYYKSKAETL